MSEHGCPTVVPEGINPQTPLHDKFRSAAQSHGQASGARITMW